MERIVAISGSPGTGKTAVAVLVAKKLQANLIKINDLVDSGEIKYARDKKRNTKIIDAGDLQRAVKKRIIKNKINIIEGLLAHLVRCGVVIVLRTEPAVLKKRLEKRDWNREKIRENIMAEALDAITIESLEKHRNVFEIDTTDKKPENTAKTIIDILKKPSMHKKYRAGHVNWFDEIKKISLSGE